MTIIKHNQNVINELLSNYLNDFAPFWGKDFETNWSNVPVNIYEDTDAYQVELNAPGRNKEDFKVNIDNNLLTISYEKKETSEEKKLKHIRKEFQFLSFKRSFTLDEKVNSDKILAKYENGILKIFIPKKEAIKISPKQVVIE